MIEVHSSKEALEAMKKAKKGEMIVWDEGNKFSNKVLIELEKYLIPYLRDGRIILKGGTINKNVQ